MSFTYYPDDKTSEKLDAASQKLRNAFSRMASSSLSAAMMMHDFAKASEKMNEHLPSTRDVMIAFPSKQALNMFTNERIESTFKRSIFPDELPNFAEDEADIHALLSEGIVNISRIAKSPAVIIKKHSIGLAVKSALHISDGHVERKALIDFVYLSNTEKEKGITIFKGCSVGPTIITKGRKPLWKQ